MNLSIKNIFDKNIKNSPKTREQFLKDFPGSVPYSSKSDPNTIIRWTLSPWEDSKWVEVIFTPTRDDPRNQTGKFLPKQFALHMDTFFDKYKTIKSIYQESSKKDLMETLKNSKSIPHIRKYATTALTLLFLINTQNANNQVDSFQVNDYKERKSPEEIIEIENYTIRTQKIDQILNKHHSKIESLNILKYCTEYKEPIEMALGILQNESHYGTRGLGARFNNPGNVVNWRTGQYAKFSSIKKWVKVCIGNIWWRINEFEKTYGHRNYTIREVMENQGLDGKGFISTQENYLKENKTRQGAYAENPDAVNNVVIISKTINIPEYPKSTFFIDFN